LHSSFAILQTPFASMALRGLCLLAFVGAAGATELTSSTWDAAVAGKTVFVKFQAPW